MPRTVSALAVAGALLALSAANAHAGDAKGDRPAGACYLDGMAFSAGTVARVGTMPKICGSDDTWQQTDQQTAGCIYASKFYGTGTRLPLEPEKKTVLECLSDGTWSPVPETPVKDDGSAQ